MTRTMMNGAAIVAGFQELWAFGDPSFEVELPCTSPTQAKQMWSLLRKHVNENRLTAIQWWEKREGIPREITFRNGVIRFTWPDEEK